MGCRLDFLSYRYGSSTPLVESDGELTVEFAEMERYANLAATSNTVNDYWCALATRPELLCLDIAGPSTLSNSLNTTTFDLTSDTVFSNGEFIVDIYETADNTSLNLFGQYDKCDGKVVGDGLINVFDIATMIAYIFKDYEYAGLDRNPGQVATVQGRDRLHLQCDDPVTRVDYLSSYAADTCVYFDNGRRLQSLTPVTAQTLWRRWQSMPLLTPQDSPMTTRTWLPAVGANLDMTMVPARQLAVAQHSLYPEYDYPDGRWYTLRTASVSLRLHVVLTGLPGGQTNTKLTYRLYDGLPPDDPMQQEIRYTRLCEFARCDSTCASIETAHPSRVAMRHNTLELLQRPIADACPFETHIWVPYRSATDDRCVGLEYLMIGDGVRGQFARDTACTRNLLFPPPPTPLYVGSSPPRPPPAPVVSYVPPPPPNASLSFPPPPSADPPSADKTWVWIVAVTVLVLGCGCLCVALIATRRHGGEKEVYDDAVTLGGGMAPIITRTQGLGSANPNPATAPSNGHMTERRDVEEQTILPPPIQPNNYDVTSYGNVMDDIGLAPRHVPNLLDTSRATSSTLQVNRYNGSSSQDGIGLGDRRPPPPPIGKRTHHA